MIFNSFRFFLVVLLVLFQYSFLNFLFSENVVPNIVAVFVVSYVAILGFEKINALLDDDDFRKALGEKARKHVQDTYSWEIIAKKYCEVIKKEINKFKK